MTSSHERQNSFLDELDARQDDLLVQLDQLNSQIEALLSQFSAPASKPSPLNWPENATLSVVDAGDDV